MPLPYPSLAFTPFDILTAAELNQMMSNITALQDWSAFNAGTFPMSLVATNGIPADKIGQSAIYLGHATATTNTTNTTTTPVQVTGMSLTVTVPNANRKIRITARMASLFTTVSGKYATFQVWRGTVGSGTLVTSCSFNPQSLTTSTAETTCHAEAIDNPTPGSVTYNCSIVLSAAGGGSAGVAANSQSPGLLLAEVL